MTAKKTEENQIYDTANKPTTSYENSKALNYGDRQLVKEPNVTYYHLHAIECIVITNNLNKNCPIHRNVPKIDTFR